MTRENIKDVVIVGLIFMSIYLSLTVMYVLLVDDYFSPTYVKQIYMAVIFTLSTIATIGIVLLMWKNKADVDIPVLVLYTSALAVLLKQITLLPSEFSFGITVLILTSLYVIARGQ